MKDEALGFGGQYDSALFFFILGYRPISSQLPPHGIIPTGSGPTLFTGFKFLHSPRLY